MPVKTEEVIEFEKLDRKKKQEVRDSPEWPEIAKYYTDCHDIAQHNIAVHAFRMQRRLEPIGKVEYLRGRFVLPIPHPIPKDQQWERGPDKFWHTPICDYRLEGYQDVHKCRCHRGRIKRSYQEATK